MSNSHAKWNRVVDVVTPVLVVSAITIGALIPITSCVAHLRRSIYQVLTQDASGDRLAARDAAPSARPAWLKPGTRWTYVVKDGDSPARTETVEATKSEDGWVFLEGPWMLRGWWTVRDRKVFRREAKGAPEDLVLDLATPEGDTFQSKFGCFSPGVFEVTLNTKEPAWPEAPTFEMRLIWTRVFDAGIMRASFSEEVGILSFTEITIAGEVEYQLVDHTTSAPPRR